MKNNQEELWITNINRNQSISIGDLRITLPRGVSINLYAKKKNGQSLYNLTKKQIEDSITKGSLFSKSQHIKIRRVSPEVIAPPITEVATVLDTTSVRTVRKPTEIEVVDYPDLDADEGTDEEFAAQNADMDVADRTPLLAVDPVFKNSVDDE